MPSTLNDPIVMVDGKHRHDKNGYLQGFAGYKFWNLLKPYDKLRVITPAETIPSDTRGILCLGDKSLQRLGYNEPLLKLRGYPLEYNGIPVIATIHPQDAMDRRNYGEKQSQDEEKDFAATQRQNYDFWMTRDIWKFKRILKEGHRSYKDQPTFIRPSMGEVIAELEYAIGQRSPVIVDIETNSNRELTCIGLGLNGVVFVVPFWLYTGQLAYEPVLYARFFRYLALAFRNCPIIAHNGAFDFFVLAYKYGLPIPRKAEDTMIMHHRCYPTVEKSLSHCISLYTDLPYHKDEGVFEPQNHAQQDALWKYNAKDITTTGIIYDEILATAVRHGNVDSMTFGNRSIRPYLIAMLRGLKINEAKVEELQTRRRATEKRYQFILTLLAKQELNPRSPQQVCNYLYKQLGFKKPFKDPTKEANLLKLINKRPVPSVNVILRMRGLRKLSSTLEFNRWRGDRVTTAYSIAGTETFRLRSRKLFSWRGRKNSGYGTNLQNWHKDNKVVVVPDDGKIFIQCDQAGAEAMIVSYLCRRGNFRRLVESGVKTHVYVALHLFSAHWQKMFPEIDITEFLLAPVENLRELTGWKPLENAIKNDALKYMTGKTVCHASNYDMKAPTMQTTAMVKSDNQLILSIKQCQHYRDTYRRLFPEIPEWHIEVQQQLRKDRILRNLYGHRRKFDGYLDESAFKEAYAYVPQSTSGCLSHEAAFEIQDLIDRRKIEPSLEILQNNHDSLLFQVNEGREAEVIPVIQKFFNRTFEAPDGSYFTMKSEVGVGHNWKPYDKTKNPEGLKE